LSRTSHFPAKSASKHRRRQVDPPYSDRKLKRRIRRLTRIFKRCQSEQRPGRRRFAHRRYLEAVYKLFARIGAGRSGTATAKQLARLYGVPIRENADLLRAIIDSSARGLDAKMASRWARALTFVWRQRQHWTDWQAFLNAHGGIEGCASALASSRKDARKLLVERERADVIAERRRAARASLRASAGRLSGKPFASTAEPSPAESKAPVPRLVTGNQTTSGAGTGIQPARIAPHPPALRLRRTAVALPCRLRPKR
jgi:hypothetical protein